MLFAEVILPLPLHERYTYLIPEAFQDKVRPGVRVLVQFGKRKNYSALVTSIIHDAPLDFEAKSIEAVLDDNPVVFRVNMDLWEWISEYYICPLGEVMNAALPSALKLEGLDGVVEEKYREKTRTIICLNPELANPDKWDQTISSLSRAPKQKKLLEYFAELTELTGRGSNIRIDRKTLLQISGLETSVLNQLIGKKILFPQTETVSRLETENVVQSSLNLLNQWQEEAITQIREEFKQKLAVLLHGVTASGKTEIYIHLIEEIVNKRRQVLYLVPEIALTPQIVSRLKKVFGNKVGVYHSKMSDAERVEIWKKVLQFGAGHKDGYQIILGARSAIFLPFNDLGLIVVDEEHESSYKQHDPAPRYHARDMAIVLGQQHNAQVLLGSATPSF